jgi:hypothetical protein
MNEDRRKILEMLATGKITADEADRLLAAMETGPADSSAAGAAASGPKRKPQFLRVLVEDEGRKGPVKVNVRVPMQLLRAGVRLASLIPPEARDRVNSQLRREGVPFDLNQVTPRIWKSWWNTSTPSPWTSMSTTPRSGSFANKERATNAESECVKESE